MNFGWRYDGNGNRRFHQGIDINGFSSGTDIYSSSVGTVILSAELPSYGNIVQIRSGNANYQYYYFIYQHLLSRSVSSGNIDQQTIIGKLGSTGDSSGPHLHYSVSRSDTLDDNGRDFLDPLSVLSGHKKFYN